jgi:hypothetical protein
MNNEKAIGLLEKFIKHRQKHEQKPVEPYCTDCPKHEGDVFLALTLLREPCGTELPVVYIAANKTSSATFQDREDAERYAGNAGAAAGIIVTEIPVIPSQKSRPDCQSDEKPSEVGKFVCLVEEEVSSEYPNRDRVLDACKWLKIELQAQAQKVDKLEAEVGRLKKVLEHISVNLSTRSKIREFAARAIQLKESEA